MQKRPDENGSDKVAQMMNAICAYFSAMVHQVALWRRPTAIDDLSSLADFCFAQSAHIAQTTLYGYLRTRAGLQHFNLFTDEKFAAMLRPARSRLVLVCVDDLALFCTAVIGARAALPAPILQELAAYMMRHAIRELADGDLPQSELDAYAHAFDARAAQADWQAHAGVDYAFERSPQALVDLAPIVDILKELDSEVVVNSMRFKWRGVRAAFRQRLDVDTLVARSGLGMAEQGMSDLKSRSV